MGTLTPNTTYIYERVGDKIYARESGKLDRKLIGYNINKDLLSNEKIKQDAILDDILAEAEKNVALQHALENVIMLYRLSKNNPL